VSQPKGALFVTTLFDDRKTPSKVTVGFVMAMNAAKKGHQTTVILMVDAVHLGVPTGVDGIDVGAPFKPVRELLEALLAAGGKVVVCASCMEAAKLTREQLDPRFGVVSGPEVVDLLMAAQGTFQVA
jgi:tRNA 2-thiouridine synthesizing protein D